MEEEYYEIDTKGMCLLCFKECSNETNYSSSEKASYATSFKLFLRYLKIDIKNLCKFPSYFLQSMDALVDINAIITTCPECTEVQKRFGILFQEFERIRLQLDKCVQSLHHRMTTGSNNQLQIKTYQNRMRTTNPTKLFDAYVAERLRNQVLHNCELRNNASVPKVLMVQTDVIEDAPTKFPPGPASRSQPRLHPFRNRTPSQLPTKSSEPIKIVSTQSVGKDSELRLKDSSDTWGNSLAPEFEIRKLSEGENMIVKVEPSSMSASVEETLNTNNDPSAISSASQSNSKSDQSNLVSYVENSEIFDMNKSSKNTCSYCGKSFATAPGLWGHMQIHTRGNTVLSNRSETALAGVGKRKFRKCETCGKSVLNLSRHMKSHRREQEKPISPIACNHCDREFSTYNNYRLHFVTMHTMEAFSKYLPPGTTEVKLLEVLKNVLDTSKSVLRADGRSTVECPYCKRNIHQIYNLKTHVLHCHFDKVLMHFQRLHEGEGQPQRLNVSADGHEFTVTVGCMDDDEGAIIDPESLMTSSVSYEMDMDQEEQPQSLFDPLG